jgi:hypothetical protein
MHFYYVLNASLLCGRSAVVLIQVCGTVWHPVVSVRLLDTDRFAFLNLKSVSRYVHYS